MLTRNDREERVRRLRRLLLDYMTKMASGRPATGGLLQDLLRVQEELKILIRLETPKKDG